MCAKKTTMWDVAKAADVSQSTVSQILNKKTASFPPATVEKVLQAAAALNYNTPKLQPSCKGSTILLICVQTTNPYYTSMQQGIDRLAIPLSINVVICCSYHNPELEASFLEMSVKKGFAGVIYLYPPDNMDAFQKTRSQIPIVVVCDRSSEISGDVIELNNFDAGALSARHLLSLGHENIAVLYHASDRITTSRATRISGILAEIRKSLSDEHLLQLSSNYSQSRYLSENSLHYQVGYSLAQNPKIYQNNITGFICVNDMLAYGVMDALAEKGYRVPEDFSVVGSDNLLFSGMSNISLTTVEHHPDLVAEAAFTMLLNRQQMRSTSNASFQTKCQPILISRGSTGPVRSSPLN